MRKFLAALSGLTVLFVLLSIWMLSGDGWKAEESRAIGVEEVPHFTVVQIHAVERGKGIDPELEPIARRLTDDKCFADLPRMEYISHVSVPRGGEAVLGLRDGKTIHFRSVGNFLVRRTIGKNGDSEVVRRLRCKKDVFIFDVVMVPEGDYFRCKAYPGTILWIDCPWSVFDKDAEKGIPDHLSFNHPHQST
jgi:hypothetical protein